MRQESSSMNGVTAALGAFVEIEVIAVKVK